MESLVGLHHLARDFRFFGVRSIDWRGGLNFKLTHYRKIGCWRSSRRSELSFCKPRTLRSRLDQLPAGVWSQVIIRRQEAASELLIGAWSQRAILRRATATRLGPLSIDSDRTSVPVSEGASQYGLTSVKDCFALLLDRCRSPVAPAIDKFSIAPSCSCDALIVLNMLRANQTPAIKNAS